MNSEQITYQAANYRLLRAINYFCHSEMSGRVLCAISTFLSETDFRDAANEHNVKILAQAKFKKPFFFNFAASPHLFLVDLTNIDKSEVFIEKINEYLNIQCLLDQNF